MLASVSSVRRRISPGPFTLLSLVAAVACCLDAATIGPERWLMCTNTPQITADGGPSSCSNGVGGASAYIDAAQGKLGAESHITLNNFTDQYFAGAASLLTTPVTFYGPPGSYQVQLTFTLSGTYSTSGPAPPVLNAFFTWLPYGQGDPNSSSSWTYGGPGWNGSFSNTVTSAAWTIQSGITYDWVFWLASGSVRWTTGPAVTGTASGNFMNTATITGGIITDMDGNAVTGVGYSTPLGPLPFNIEGAQFVPEPSAAILVPLGAAILYGLRRRLASRQ